MQEALLHVMTFSNVLSSLAGSRDGLSAGYFAIEQLQLVKADNSWIICAQAQAQAGEAVIGCRLWLGDSARPRGANGLWVSVIRHTLSKALLASPGRKIAQAAAIAF